MKKVVNARQNVMGKNNQIASENRKKFDKNKMFVINMVSSPGSGKTTILEETLKQIKDKVKCAVIEGDQQTNNDADRIAKVGVPVYQINTVNSCHLNATQVEKAFNSLCKETSDIKLLFIENVGNLICPSAYFLGEDMKVIILSTTEGEDKPVKYPVMFRKSSVMILNKIDLVPHVDFDVQTCVKYAEQINPDLEVFQLSAKTREGFENWITWILSKVDK